MRDVAHKDDIVKRLRHYAWAMERFHPTAEIMREAATDIEHLRGLICWTLDAISGGSSLAEIQKVLSKP
jgi:hypothetical protein